MIYTIHILTIMYILKTLIEVIKIIVFVHLKDHHNILHRIIKICDL